MLSPRGKENRCFFKRIENTFFAAVRILLLIISIFTVSEGIWVFIAASVSFPTYTFIYMIQVPVTTLIFALVGFWIALRIRNPLLPFLILSVYIFSTILRNVKTMTSAVLKYFLRPFYPLMGIVYTSPTFEYFSTHGIGNGFVGDYVPSLFASYPMSALWGMITCGMLSFLVVFLILCRFAGALRIGFIRLIRKIKRVSRDGDFNGLLRFRKNLIDLFTGKVNIKVFLIPLILLNTVSYATLFGFGMTVRVDPGNKPISIAFYGMPEELRKDNLNKTWLENTTEGRAFVSALARHNAIFYIHLSPGDIDTPAEKEEYADYFNYLYGLGIRVSIDRWCNIRHYFTEWLPMFKAVVEFRTDPSYKDRLKGLVGVSGDFEPDPARGIDSALFRSVKENITAELEWMRGKLTEANLTGDDFKFGAISGVPLDAAADGDYDVEIFSENWFDLNYDFNCPMFYKDGLWMSRLYMLCRLQKFYRDRYHPDMELRVLLGVTGRGRYQPRFGVDAAVREINIARMWGVVSVGFYTGYGPYSIFNCFIGTEAEVNGTKVTVTRYNVIDVIMEKVYENSSFYIPARSLPEYLPEDMLGMSPDNSATEFRDFANLDWNNMLDPLGWLWKDLYLNIDRVISVSFAIALFSVIVGIWTYIRIFTENKSRKKEDT